MIGYYVEGKTHYLLECRSVKDITDDKGNVKKAGTCFYRKFTDEDKTHYLFNRIPQTTVGHAFVARPITDEMSRRLPIVADRQVMNYISRELCKLKGIELNPEAEHNIKQIVKQESDGGVFVKRKDSKGRVMEPVLVDEYDPESDIKLLKPVSDSLQTRKQMIERGEMPENKQNFQPAEAGPEDFDPDAFLRGETVEYVGNMPEEPQSYEEATQKVIEGIGNEQFNVNEPPKKSGRNKVVKE